MSIQFTGEWERWARLMDPAKFEARLKREIRRATQANGLEVVAAMRKGIQSGDYEPNAFLTLAAKAPRSKPLVHHGDLFGAIAQVMIDDFSVFVGVKRGAKTDDGEDVVNIAAALHEGFELEVTPEMRAAVFAKIRENPKSKSVRPDQDRPAEAVWIIPPRPFIRAVIERSDIQRKIMDNWTAATVRALFGA